ncbi:phenylacetate-CoA oxygenase/reductase subunit PaaK [Ravibacter arvi]|uniref:Phenylacetate-CoA oxygenase/reductase subunit PaaK n=1 Tax=Ravibacter arvi TaxID=2051041 RepID=A0ABP8LR52_9BACT
MNEYELRITKIEPRPGDNITISMETTNGYPLPYKAGQFLTLKFLFGEREVRRSYSFSSSPHVDEPPAITIKRIDNGEISRLLHHKTHAGDLLSVLEPQGLFTYEPEPEKERTVFLFGAGIGITPLFSIMKTALVAERASKVVLIFSNSNPEVAPFMDEIKQWETRYPERLRVIWLFSNNKNLLRARLNRFNLEEFVRQHLQFDRRDALFYSCGPVTYMDLCRITLLGMGFESAQIRRETFLPPENEEDEDDDTEKVIDKTPYEVQIHFQGKVYDLVVPYDHSILDEALKHKIRLPYSCRSGMCSTCIARCTAGNVRMDYNEVLTDQDIAAGSVLTCTGHPTENHTVIVY